MIKKMYRIPDMMCSNCAMALESIEDQLDGIKSIKASYHKQTLEVVYDEKLLAEDALIEAIKKKHFTPVAVI
jgi:copper chaperone CopZ